MSEHCPTCGSEVVICSSDEGTSFYQPMPANVPSPTAAKERKDPGFIVLTWGAEIPVVFDRDLQENSMEFRDKDGNLIKRIMFGSGEGHGKA